jgi:VWFA-related protein
MKTFRPTGTAFFLPAFLAAWTFLAPAVAALRPDPSSQDAVRLPIPLQHAVTVTLKLVQVYVTDKQGKPVRDLAKEDFTVTDNGRIMALTEFEKHVLEAAPPPPLAPPPEEKIVATAVPPAAATNRKFFLFFDFANNNQRGVVKAQEAALHFLDAELLPGDEVGLMSYSTVKGLAVHEYLSTDHGKVREAVAGLNAKGLSGRADDVEAEYWRLMTQESRPQDLSNDVAARRLDSKSQARAFILKLTALAKAFRYIPGHKNLLLFSTGIVGSLIYGNQSGTPQGTSGLSDRSGFALPDYVLITDYEAMLKELSAANCSIFSFDSREAAKVPTLFDYDEQTFGSRQSRDMFSQGGVQQNSNLVFKDEKVTGLYTLGRLAATTGGKYFGNINEYERNLDQLQALTGSYYVLGYSIGEQEDGRFHEIKVSVKRKGCEVRAQSGYFNPKPFAEYSDLEKQLHLFDLALSDRPFLQTPAVFSLEALSYAAGEEPRLQMLAKIPAAVLDKFSGKKVEIVAIVFDDKDNVAGLQRREADLSKYRGMDVFFTSGAALAPGNYRCRIVIRDLATGTAAVASSPARVAKPATVGLSLHTPLLLVAESNFAYLEAAPSKTREKLGWAEAYPFDRARYSPLGTAAPAGTAKIYAALPCSVTGLVSPDIALAAHLVRTATGESIDLPFTVLTKTDLAGAEIRFLEIPLTGVPAGKYRLYLHAEDAASHSVSYAQTILTLTSDGPIR